MRVLVTGCTGFVGRNLVAHLIKKKHRVYCMSRNETCENSDESVHIPHDLTRELDYNKLPPKLDCIIHLAATMRKDVKKAEIFRINTHSTLNLLQYGEEIGIKRFIFISSGAVYGYSINALSERSPIRPVDSYGLSKYQSEQLVSHYSKHFSTVILRLFFPYGPGQVNGIIPRLAANINDGKPILIYNRNNPRINPTYITDVVKAIDKSLTVKGCHVFNVGGNEIISVKELSFIIGKSIGKEPIFTDIKDKKIMNLMGDNAKMRDVLGVVPKIRLEQGLKQYLKQTLDSEWR